jgi:hypothetical protein
MENPIWCDSDHVKLWMYCLFKASHKDHSFLWGSQVVELKRGQFVIGRNSLSDDMNRGVKPKKQNSESTWRRYLSNLEKLEMLNIKPTNKFSVVTIDKYDFYQSIIKQTDQQSEQQMNNKRTTDEQQMNTNNNDNNDNHDNKKENIYTIFEHWNSQKIIVHRKMNKKMESHINARLADYSLDDLLTAISNLKTIIADERYYWTHKYTLEDFMLPDNVVRFVDENDPFTNFLAKKGKQHGTNTNAKELPPEAKYLPF